MDYFDDTPSSDFKKDKLERVTFAEKIARRIEDSFNPDSSIIFGLTGEWGSGKTQVLKYVDEILRNRYTNWQVAWFTPWAAGDSSSLLEEYVATLADTLDEGDELNNFYDRIDPLVNIAAPVIEVALQAPGALRRGYKYAKGKHQHRNSWRKSAEGLSDSFVRRGRKTLIIADDVDRLSHTELDTFLKLLRGLGEIKGVYYLIAYDELSLAETISGSFAGDLAPELGRRYLEKFIQYHFTIPAMTRYQLFTWLRSEFYLAFKHMPSELEDSKEGLVECLLIWQKLIRTPRSIRRFGANLELVAADFNQGQISILDLANIIVLRQFFPSVFAQLPPYRDELTFGRSSAGLSDALVEGVAARHQGTAKALMKKLFASTFEGKKEQETPRTVDNFYFFDRYVTGLLPSDNESELRISSAVDTALGSDPAPLTQILHESNDEIYDLPEKLLADILMRDDLQEFDLVPLTGIILRRYELEGNKRTVWRDRLEKIASFLLMRSAPPFDSLSRELCGTLMPITVTEVALKFSKEISQNSNLHELWTLGMPYVLEGFLDHVKRGTDADLNRDALQMAKFIQLYGGTMVRPEIARAARAGGEPFMRDYVSRFVETKNNQDHQSVVDDFNDELFETLTSFTADVLAICESSQDASRTSRDSWEAREIFALHTIWRNRSKYQLDTPDL